MSKGCSVTCIATVLAAVGAINWGLVALLKFDLVAWLAALVNLPVLATILYVLVGISGVLLLLKKFGGCGGSCER